MKKQIALILPSILFVLLSVSVHGQFITGFGSGDFTKTYSDFTDTQTATNYSIQGLDNGALLSGSITPIYVGTPSLLSLTGTITTNPNSNFGIVLQDSLSNQLVYTGNWSAFSSASTISLNYSSSSGSFNGIVSSIAILTSGSGGSLNFTFDALSAVPEPSAIMLLGAAMSGLALCRVARRKA